jgi:hypothetical protein
MSVFNNLYKIFERLLALLCQFHIEQLFCQTGSVENVANSLVSFAKVVSSKMKKLERNLQESCTFSSQMGNPGELTV